MPDSTPPPSTDEAPSHAQFKPHESHGLKIPRNRNGDPCSQCRRKGSACHWHGGKSTGPKSEAGKRRVRQNGVKHQLNSNPERFRVDMSASVRKLFEEQVEEICRAEGITEVLDVELVRSFVTTLFMEREARDYLMERGVVPAEEFATIEGPEGRLRLTSSRDEEILTPVVNQSLLAAYKGLVRLKRELHAHLRLHSGKRGDEGHTTAELRIIHSDDDNATKP